jgi:hypothetical protein
MTLTTASAGLSLSSRKKRESDPSMRISSPEVRSAQQGVRLGLQHEKQPIPSLGIKAIKVGGFTFAPGGLIHCGVIMREVLS